MGLGGALQVRREIQPGLCGRGAAREGLAGGGEGSARQEWETGLLCM